MLNSILIDVKKMNKFKEELYNNEIEYIEKKLKNIYTLLKDDQNWKDKNQNKIPKLISKFQVIMEVIYLMLLN